MTNEELTELLPAYVLGALEPDERRAVEHALAADPDAQALLAQYEASATSLAALAPLRPAPGHLQADLAARLAARRQPPRRQGVRPQRAPRVLLAAAALLIVIAGGVIAALLLSDEGPEADSAQMLYDELAALDGARRFAVVPGDVKPDVSGELVASPDGERAVIRVEALPALSEENVFQLWLVDDSGVRTSGGLFRQARDDVATYIEIPLAASFEAYQGFGVSLEPAGGSPYPDRPTGPRVFAVPIEA